METQKKNMIYCPKQDIILWMPPFYTHADNTDNVVIHHAGVMEGAKEFAEHVNCDISAVYSTRITHGRYDGFRPYWCFAKELIFEGDKIEHAKSMCSFIINEDKLLYNFFSGY
jgi:hypothetical protein